MRKPEGGGSLKNGILIRKAEPADGPLILSLIRELADYEKGLDQVDARPDMLASALFGERPRVFCNIAEYGGAPAGFAIWFYNFSTWRGRHGIYLEDLFVRPKFRGHGIGKALLADLARRAVAEGCPRLEWWVLNWNAPAIAFYKALGAEPMEDWTVFRLSGEALAQAAKE